MDLTEDLNDNLWVTEDWFAEPEEPRPTTSQASEPDARPTAPMSEPELRALLTRFDVNNLVEVVCGVCLENPPNQLVMVPCGHLICADCKERSFFCPDCRSPIVRTVKFNVSSMRVAWRSDLASNFGTEGIVLDPALDGNRPGDETEEQFRDRISRELAEQLAAQDAVGQQVIPG